MSYHALVVTAHPDDAEAQMGGTLAKLSDRGQRILLVDLTEGEPSDFAPPGERARQAARAAAILGVERLTLKHQDRLLSDEQPLRLEVAALIRQHRPGTVYAIRDACVHPDHVASRLSYCRGAKGGGPRRAGLDRIRARVPGAGSR